MSDIETTTIKERGPLLRGVAAAGGVLGALGASACCVLPLVFVLLGVSGAWIGALSAFGPYKPYFLVLGAVSLSFGFWQVYGRRTRVCAEGTACAARPLPGGLVKSALWLAALLLLLSATVTLWAPLFY